MAVFHVRVIAFAQLGEVVPQSSRIDLQLPLDAGSIRSALLARFPALADATFRVAIDQRFRTDEEEIDAIEEIALFPPFAGG